MSACSCTASRAHPRKCVPSEKRSRARVINSPKHMKRFLLALQENIAKYEQQFGKIDVSGPMIPPLRMPQ